MNSRIVIIIIVIIVDVFQIIKANSHGSVKSPREYLMQLNWITWVHRSVNSYWFDIAQLMVKRRTDVLKGVSQNPAGVNNFSVHDSSVQ